MSDVVMSGSLGAFDIPAILQAMSLSRQYTRLRLWSEANAKTGEIRMKAGQILQAESSTLIGKDAFLAILEGAHATFSVERCEDPEQFSTPLGSIASLLLSSASRPEVDLSEPEDQMGESLTFSPSLTESVIVANDPAVPEVAPPPPAPGTTPPPAPSPSFLAKAPPAPAPIMVPAPPPKPRAAPKASGLPFKDLDASFVEPLRQYQGLAFLILAKVGSEETPQRRWVRSGSDASAPGTATIALETLALVNQARGSQDRGARVSLELAENTIVAHRLPNGWAFVGGFDPVLPLGVIRHICKVIEPQIEKYLERSAKRSKLAG